MRLIRDLGVLFVFASTTTSAANGPQPLDLDALRGRVVYVDFWASWCVPCRQSFPWMQTLQTTYGPQGFTIVAVNLDHERVDADAFLRKFKHDFDVRFDPQGVLAEKFNVQGMPSSRIIDRQGHVRFTHVGFRPGDAESYAGQIRQLLAEH